LIPNVLTQIVASSPERAVAPTKTEANQAQSKDEEGPSFEEAVRDLDQRENSMKEEIAKGDQGDYDKASGAERRDADIAQETEAEDTDEALVLGKALQEPDTTEPFKMPKIPEVTDHSGADASDFEMAVVKEQDVDKDTPIEPVLGGNKPIQLHETAVQSAQSAAAADLNTPRPAPRDVTLMHAGDSPARDQKGEKHAPPKDELLLQKAGAVEFEKDEQPRAAPGDEIPVAAAPKENGQAPKHIPIAIKPEAERASAEPRREAKSETLPITEAHKTAPPPPPPETQTRPPALPLAPSPQTFEQSTQMSLYTDADTEVQRLEFGANSTQTGGSQANSTFMSQAFARTEMPRSLAFQLQEAARGLGGQPVEVSLHPEELGRVRLSIAASEIGVSLHILAERPETLDMMRRHAEMLAKELGEIGFASIDLAFGQGHAAQSGEQETPFENAAGSPQEGSSQDASGEPDTPPPPLAVTRISDQGVDIRI
jgi:flagellar hook-length control protein FliK